MKKKRTVTTKEELKKAKEDGVDIITVTGELANNLIISKKITTLGSVALGILTVSLAGGFMTGGITSAVAAPIALSSGLSVDVILAIVAVGGAVLVLAIFKDYELEFIHKDIKGNVDELKLRKRDKQ